MKSRMSQMNLVVSQRGTAHGKELFQVTLKLGILTEYL